MTDGGQPQDFEITKYGFDRDHELSLNQFQHALEFEQLKLLIFLNGGAATALLAFAEKTKTGFNSLLFGSAIVAWLVGLLVGTWATIGMRGLQSDYAKSLRYRRLATEWRRLPEKLPGLDPKLIIELPDGKTPDEAATQRDNAILCDLGANAVRDGARREKINVVIKIWASLALFIIGAILAMCVVLASARTAATDRGEPTRSSAPADQVS